MSWVIVSALSSTALVASPPLEGIANCRPVSSSLPGLFRSAALEQATAADAAQLLDGMRIRTIVDLRNDDEIERAQAESSPFGRALVAAFDRGCAVGPGCAASEGRGVLRRYHVPLLSNTEGFFEEVARRMSPARQAEALLYRGFDGRKYDQLLYDEVGRGKQSLLYTCMLETSPCWQEALSTAADRREGAVLIHCAQGKDRTGVLAALLQHAAGDDPKQIVESYAASEALLRAFDDDARPTGASVQQPAKAGVDWSALRGSPPEQIEKTFEWVRRTHGSIDGFLASVGCEDRWRQILLTTPR